MNSEINKKSKVVVILLSVLLLTVIGYIIYDKIINQKKVSNNNELIEKVMEENSDYEYIDISYFDETKYGKEISDYKYVEDEYEYSLSYLGASIKISVKNGKLSYKLEEQEYESKMFSNVKKASVTVAGGTFGFQKIIVLTTDGNLYESIPVYKVTQDRLIIDNFEGKNNKEILDTIDKSFKQIKLTAFNVNDFKFTRYIYGVPVLVAIDSDNNKTLITCDSDKDYCTRINDQGILDYVRTFGGEMPTIINKDGSICIYECKQNGKVKYNNDILKIQSIFMVSEGTDVSNYFDYAIDREGYLYKVNLYGMPLAASKASESPVKKIGYKKLNDVNISIIFLCEDGTYKKFMTSEDEMFDYSGKIVKIVK